MINTQKQVTIVTKVENKAKNETVINNGFMWFDYL